LVRGISGGFSRKTGSNVWEIPGTKGAEPGERKTGEGGPMTFVERKSFSAHKKGVDSGT